MFTHYHEISAIERRHTCVFVPSAFAFEVSRFLVIKRCKRFIKEEA